MTGTGWYLILLVTVLTAACTLPESQEPTATDPAHLYFDYKISGAEDAEDVTILLQYRLGGAYGPSVAIEPTAKADLDGESIHGDSSKSTGAYYEVRKPLEGFTGDHTITFTSGSGKKISETFQFEPLRLLEDLPDSVHRGDLVIPLAGAGDGDFIRVLLTDTSFTSWGIDRIDTIMNGRLVITGQQLGALVNGPVHMELIKELDKRVKNKVSRGGRVSVTFGLSREFYLVSSPARP